MYRVWRVQSMGVERGLVDGRPFLPPSAPTPPRDVRVNAPPQAVGTCRLRGHRAGAQLGRHVVWGYVRSLHARPDSATAISTPRLMIVEPPHNTTHLQLPLSYLV